MTLTIAQRKTVLINRVDKKTGGAAKLLKFNEYSDGRFILWYYTILSSEMMSHGALIEEKESYNAG